MSESREPLALAVIDGEHYPAVVNAALAALPYRFAAVYLAGGQEKLRDGTPYSVPCSDSLTEALALPGLELVVDLADEPVLEPSARMRLISQALAAGLPYRGADFSFHPPAFAAVPYPAIAVVGSGKRVGKTAVSGYAARLLSRDRRLVVVAMGRGGPPLPELVDSPPDIAALLTRSRAGGHAASDYLEDAALTGVRTVGARRAGGGLAGAAAFSNVAEAAALAADLSPDLVLFEGSGAVLPPVACPRLLVGAADRPDLLFDFLGPYRVLLADAVVLTRCEEPFATAAEVKSRRQELTALKELTVITSVLRPRPTAPVAGRRVAFFSTAPVRAVALLHSHLEEVYGADVVHVSSSLADRRALAEELRRMPAADVYLTEVKAAAIDMVAEMADAQGIELVLADNEIEVTDGDLDACLRSLAAAAMRHGVGESGV